ncbi:MAG: hydrogenase maturation nickel metallochaperone HypA [Pseudomonadales bacterium]|nr:hydrogenase maturation nickel metallochaperone HypA [Pseudomonadales bacterium]
MHELSLCENIIDIIKTNAATQAFKKVNVVCLEVGTLSCVEPEALRFSFDAVSKNTLAQHAHLDIIQLPGLAQCSQCCTTHPVENKIDACPQCGHYPLQIIQGEELRVKNLEVE